MPLVAMRAKRRKPKRNRIRPTTNPLRADPTRTATLRRRFLSALRGRLRALQTAITRLVVEENAFGLGGPRPFRPLGNELTTNQRFRFHSDSQKVGIFQNWLKTQMGEKILAGEIGQAEDAYWSAYVKDAYEKGQGRSFDDYMKKARKFGNHEGDFYQGTKRQFLQSSFARPVAIEKVKLLAARVYTELEGVTQQMSSKLTRGLADGIAQGMSPREVGRRMANDITGIGKGTGESARVRTDRIARTETIRAHAEGQLDALEDLGVTELGVMVEWSATGDILTCPLCADLDGITISIKKARGILPRHPNCRCAWMPAGVGEDKKGQKRGPAAQKAIDTSVGDERSQKAKRDGVSIADQKERSSWGGAKTKPGKPLKSILDKGNRLVDGKVVTITKSVTGRTGGITSSIPKDITDNLTPEEMKRFRRLAKDRGTLKKKVKAGTATTEELALVEQYSTELNELRALARSRVGIVKPPVTPPVVKPLVDPKPKRIRKPKPKPPEKPASKVTIPSREGVVTADETTGIETLLANDEELNQLEKLGLEIAKPGIEKIDRLAGEYEDLSESITRSYSKVEKVWSEASGGAKWGEPGYKSVSEVSECVKIKESRVLMEEARNEINKQLKEARSVLQDKMHKMLALPENAQNIEFVPHMIGQASKKDKTLKTLSKVWKTKVNESSNWLSKMMKRRITKNQGTISGRKPFAVRQLKSNTRAFHRNDGGVFVSADTDLEVFVHEIGHEIEEYIHTVRSRANEFRDMRVRRAGTRTVRLKDQFPSHNYKDGETGNPDGWEKLYKGYSESSAYYVGKTYSFGSTEVTSMGMELMHLDPARFVARDPEYFKFILAIMRGKI